MCLFLMSGHWLVVCLHTHPSQTVLPSRCVPAACQLCLLCNYFQRSAINCVHFAAQNATQLVSAIPRKRSNQMDQRLAPSSSSLPLFHRMQKHPSEMRCWRHGRCSSSDVTLRAEARAPCASARGCRGVGVREHTVRTATHLAKNTETCQDVSKSRRFSVLFHRSRFCRDVTVCPYCNLENISVRRGEKTNKQTRLWEGKVTWPDRICCGFGY